jgi:integrase
VLSGVSVEHLDHIRALTNPRIFVAILTRLDNEAGGQPSGRAHQAATAVLTVARYLGLSNEEMAVLRKLKAQLPRGHTGLAARNRELLRRFEDIDLKRRLARLPGVLWSRATSGKLPPRQSLIEAQNAILIQLLLSAPLRLKNVRAFTFGVHIAWHGKNGPVLLHVEARDMKNKQDYDAVLSEPIATMLKSYRDKIVPATLGRKHDALFVSKRGRKAATTIRGQFRKAIRKGLGLELSPHQMRHIAAKLILDANPGAHELVRELLGHRSIETTVQFYSGIDVNRAVRFHDKLIRDLREEPMPSLKKTAIRNTERPL